MFKTVAQLVKLIVFCGLFIWLAITVVHRENQINTRGETTEWTPRGPLGPTGPINSATGSMGKLGGGVGGVVEEITPVGTETEKQ